MSRELQPFDDDHELAENECLEITLRAADGPNPPRSIFNLWAALSPCWEFAEAARQFVLGKGHKEGAKARKLEAESQREFQHIELDRQRMVLEQQRAADEAKQKGIEEEHRHRERMKALEMKHLRDAVESLARLKDMGVTVEISVLDKLATQLVESVVSRDERSE